MKRKIFLIISFIIISLLINCKSESQQLCEKGNQEFALNNFEKAVGYYTEAIECDNQNYDAYYNRGAARQKLRDFKEAISNYTKAIAIRNDDYEVYHNRGIAHHSLDHYTEAIEDYNKAIDLSKKNAKIYFNRAIAYYDLKQDELALTDFKISIDYKMKDKKDMVKAYNYIGGILLKQKKYKEAIKNFTKVLEIDKKNAPAYLFRAIAKENIGDKDGADNDRKLAQNYKEFLIPLKTNKNIKE